MDVHIYSVKANSQASNTWIYVMTTHTKRPKSQDTQLGVSKIYAYCQKI